jgi:hypothetical protein
MKTLPRSPEPSESQEPLEVPAQSTEGAEKGQPPSVLESACPIISIPAAPPARQQGRGFLAIEFVCPRCGSRDWGTTHLSGLKGYQPSRGQCNGTKTDEFGGGFRAIERCTFEWLRSEDWTVFQRLTRTSEGQPLYFSSSEEFEAIVGARR